MTARASDSNRYNFLYINLYRALWEKIFFRSSLYPNNAIGRQYVFVTLKIALVVSIHLNKSIDLSDIFEGSIFRDENRKGRIELF